MRMVVITNLFSQAWLPALTGTQTKRRGTQRQKEFSALLRALRVSAFILSTVCALAFRPSGVAASRQIAAFRSFIFQMAAFSRKPLRSKTRGASGLPPSQRCGATWR